MIKQLEVTDEKWMSINPKNRRLVEEFLKESTQLSDQTLKQYESALKNFFYYVKTDCEDKDFDKVKSKDYLIYQNNLIRGKMSSSGVRLKRSAISSLNQYVETYYEDLNFRNYITKKISAPPQVFVHEKEPLSLNEYKHLCEVLLEQKMYQQLAYLSFSFSTGARRNEVKQLLKEVVTYEGKTFEINDHSVTTYLTHNIRCKGAGKAGKVRRLQFDQEAMNYIKLWLEHRGEDNCEFVFISGKKKVKQISEASFNLWSEKYFEPIVGRRFHPHLIRETRATTLTVESGKDISVAQKLLGHVSSTTTEIYVVRKDKDDSDGAFG